MAGRVIQGFFIGSPLHTPGPVPKPAPAFQTPVQRTAAAGAAMAGPPAPAFAGRAAALQAHAAPRRPSPAHTPATVAQPFGGNRSFAIDPVQVGLARGGGNPLPPAVLAKMESAFAADFSGVRIHIGSQASRIGAIAFTTGNDLYFAPGQFQPHTVNGQQLIGHELAHVVQQRQGRVRAPGSGVAVVQDRALEAEADRLGMRAAAHIVPVQARLAPGASLQAKAHPFQPGRERPHGPAMAIVQRAAAAVVKVPATHTKANGAITHHVPAKKIKNTGTLSASFKKETKEMTKAAHAEKQLCDWLRDKFAPSKNQQANSAVPNPLNISADAWPCDNCDKEMASLAAALVTQVIVEIENDKSGFSANYNLPAGSIGTITY